MYFTGYNNNNYRSKQQLISVTSRRHFEKTITRIKSIPIPRDYEILIKQCRTEHETFLHIKCWDSGLETVKV